MVTLDPSQRPTFDMVLHTSRGAVFPESFYSFLHNYVSSMNDLSSPSVFAKPPITTPITESLSTTEPTPLPSDSDHRLERIWTEYESVEPYLLLPNEGRDTVTEAKVDYLSNKTSPGRLKDIFPVELHIPNRDSKLQGALITGQWAAPEDGPAMIMLSHVCANVRNGSLPSSKVRALDVLLALSSHLTDEAKLDRLVPYVIDLLHDDAAIIRGAALRTLTQVLMLVTAITPSNAAIFPEYILLNICYLTKDPNVSVRCVHEQCITPFADTSQLPANPTHLGYAASKLITPSASKPHG